MPSLSKSIDGGLKSYLTEWYCNWPVYDSPMCKRWSELGVKLEGAFTRSWADLTFAIKGKCHLLVLNGPVRISSFSEWSFCFCLGLWFVVCLWRAPTPYTHYRYVVIKKGWCPDYGAGYAFTRQDIRPVISPPPLSSSLLRYHHKHQWDDVNHAYRDAKVNWHIDSSLLYLSFRSVNPRFQSYSRDDWFSVLINFSLFLYFWCENRKLARDSGCPCQS